MVVAIYCCDWYFRRPAQLCQRLSFFLRYLEEEDDLLCGYGGSYRLILVKGVKVSVDYG